MFELVGPPNGEALARAYLEAWAQASADGIRPLALTVEDNRGVYSCDEARYRLDEKSQEAKAALFTPLVEAEKLQREGARIELGGWEETSRKSLVADETVTFVCRARRALDIVTGALEFTIIDKQGKRDRRGAVFVFVESMGAAKLSTVTFFDVTEAASSPRGPSSKGP